MTDYLFHWTIELPTFRESRSEFLSNFGGLGSPTLAGIVAANRRETSVQLVR